MRWGLVALVIVAASCGNRTQKVDPALEAARKASIATRPIPDPPWAVDGWKPEDDSPAPSPSKSPAKSPPAAPADAGVPSPVVAAKPVDAGVDAGKPAVAVKPDCLTLCQEARSCIEKIAGVNVDCDKECGRTKPDDLERGIKCRPELARGCEAWMSCLVGPRE